MVELESAPTARLLEPLAEIGYFEFCVRAKPGERRRLLDLLSSGCGTTAFIASQHEGVCRRLAEAGHPLAEAACRGEVWCGVCFAHLRRSPSPVDCLEFRDHLVFSGEGPWYTGHPMMSHVLVGGSTPDGIFYMGIAETTRTEIAIAPLPPLACMNGTGTVSLFFNALSIERSDVVVETNPSGLHQKDMHSTVYQGARSLGVARAAGAFLPPEAAQRVEQRIEHLHRRMDEWDLNPNWPDATTLRRACLQIACRAVEAGLVAEGGKSQLLSHPLSRLLREQAFYTTTQLTQDLRASVLEEL